MSGVTVDAYWLAVGAVVFLFVYCCAAATLWLWHTLGEADDQ